MLVEAGTEIHGYHNHLVGTWQSTSGKQCSGTEIPLRLKDTRIRENFCLWNPESCSKKFLFVESGTLGFGIWNTAQRIRTPINDWIPESKFHFLRESRTWNPESKPVLDSLITCLAWGEKFSKIQALLVNSRDFVLRDKTGKFPDYPDDDEGGSAAIFKEKDPAEVTFKSFSHCLIQGRGPGRAGLLLIFRPNWGPKGRKKFFLRPTPPPPHLIWRSGSATVIFYLYLRSLLTYVVEKSLMSILWLTSFLQMEKEEGQVFTFCYSKKI